MIVAAVAAGIGLLVWTLGGFLTTDATIAVDGRAHSVSVPTDGDRFLWVQEYDAASCSIIDTATGSEVAYAPLGGSYTRSGGSDAWVADRRFDPGSGRLEVTCAGADGSVQIGAAPKIGNLVGGVFAAIAIPLALGGLGLVVLIVTAVLFATGAPRRPQQPTPSYGPPPGDPPR